MPQLYDILPFTLLDFPGEMACVAWFAGCNMRCVYCHNPDIVLGKGEKDDAALLNFLKNRTGRLSGVVFSGGEATLYPGLPALIAQTKEMGFKTKLDTNGTRPAVVKDLVVRGLLDYVALDYKANPEKIKEITGNGKYWADFQETLVFLIAAAEKGLGFEVRTTVHPDLMTAEDLSWIIRDLDSLGYRGTYYIQNIASTGDKTLGAVDAPTGALDRTLLPQPSAFTIAFRNFTDEPEKN